MQNLRIGIFATVRKLHNVKIKWPVSKMPNCAYGGFYFTNQIFLGYYVYIFCFILVLRWLTWLY